MSISPIKLLTQGELANRWHLRPRTLEKWRRLRQGPPYVKVAGRVVYRIEDVEAYEATNRRVPKPIPLIPAVGCRK